jgi:hypothetical protein
MPGFLLQQGATVTCVHGGQGMPTVPNAVVTIMGMPTALLSAPWSIVGCPGIPAIPLPPCVSALFTTGTTRVTSFGQPLLCISSTANCIPNGTPAVAVVAQTRVTAM